MRKQTKITVGTSHLSRRSEEEHLVLQLVSPGRPEEDWGPSADVVAFLDGFGSCAAEARTMSGELFLSLLAAGG